MRYLVYLVAVLVAAGTVYYLGGSGSPTVATQATPAAESVPAEAGAVEAGALEAGALEAGAVQMVSLKVPGMHCPFACYPSVKKALEGEAGVQGVDLVEQKEEGLIDNPVVIIKHDAAFDLDQAVASLEKLGFAGATTTVE